MMEEKQIEEFCNALANSSDDTKVIVATLISLYAPEEDLSDTIADIVTVFTDIKNSSQLTKRLKRIFEH